MTKVECEKRLFELMNEAYAIAQEFDPMINHLSIFRINGYVHAHGGHDKGGGEMDTLTVDASKFLEEVGE